MTSLKLRFKSKKSQNLTIQNVNLNHNQKAARSYFYTILMISIITPIMVRLFVWIVQDLIAWHADSYTHSIIPYVIKVSGHIPSPDIYPYASLPLSFILNSLLSNILQLDILLVSNILYVVMLVSISLKYFLVAQNLLNRTFNVNDTPSKIVAAISTLIYSMCFMRIPTYTPQVYALVLFLLVVYANYKLLYLARPNFNRRQFSHAMIIILTIVTISITLAHHITSFVVLSFFILSIIMSDILLRIRSRNDYRDGTSIHNSYYITHLGSLIVTSAIVTYAWLNYHATLIKSIIEELFFRTEVVVAPVIGVENFPLIYRVSIWLNRVFIISVLIWGFAIWLKYLIYFFFKREHFNWHTLSVITVLMLSSLPAFFVFGIAAERSIIFVSLSLIPLALSSILKRNRKLNKIIFTLLVVSFLAILLQMFYLLTTPWPIGPTYLEYIFDYTLVYNLYTDNLIQDKIYTDFVNAMICRYSLVTLFKNEVSDLAVYNYIFTDYDPKIRDLLMCSVNTEHGHVLLVLTERSLLRFPYIFGYTVNPNMLLSCFDAILNYGNWHIALYA